MVKEIGEDDDNSVFVLLVYAINAKRYQRIEPIKLFSCPSKVVDSYAHFYIKLTQFYLDGCLNRYLGI